MPTVIKAGQTGPLLPRLTTVDLADHLQEADAVVAAAEREAARILADARSRIEQGREEARQAGYEAGYREGHNAGEPRGREEARAAALGRFDRDQARVVADMHRVIAEIDGMKMDLRIAAERDLMEFAVALATKLTFAIGRLHRDAAVENLRRAVETVGSQSDVTVRVHPDDRAAIETFAESVLARADGSRAVQIVVDGSVAPGGCTVETPRTRIDATLNTQCEEIAALLLGAEAQPDGGPPRA